MLRGDRLTDYYVRRAAAAAAKSPPDVAAYRSVVPLTDRHNGQVRPNPVD